MSKLDELSFADATTLADLVQRREVKPVELVDSAIERLERLNPKLNAVVTPLYEHARGLALDDARLPGGAFRGVPFLLKDLVAFYEGARFTAGSALMRDFVPDHDSQLVVRLKRAGLIILGKTNTPEFGLLPTTEPRLFGPTHNPWKPDRTPGGSSGGSAAAVAAGLVPMAHANDGGGSIRIPASCCGVFGLKPTRARNPLGPDFGDLLGGLVAEHAVTRSVRDSAALLDATSGPDVGDPYCAPSPARPFLQEVGIDPGRLRIAFSTSTPGVRLHPDCLSAVEDAAKLCAELGHQVKEDAPAIDRERLVQAFLAVWAAGCAAAINGLALVIGTSPREEKFEPLTWALYEMGRRIEGPSYLQAQVHLQSVSRQIARFMLNHDVWLTPTLAEPPLPLGTFDSPPEAPMQVMLRAAAFTPYAALCNISGQPAFSIPLFWNAEGLPIGSHFAGRFGDEATLFRLAAQLERARPWTGRRPPVCA